jgi:hypothetical protein
MTQPIMCTLTPDALRERRDDLLAELAARAMSRQRTADGYAFTFAASSETLLAITKVIDAERQCCRWLRFTLDVQPEGGPITLMLSGPPGAHEFLSALFD